MPSAIFQQAFNAWLDQALSEPISESIVAFSFNLAEPWSVEVIGSERFSEDDADWACEEAFRPKTKDLDLPEDEVGSSWERCSRMQRSSFARTLIANARAAIGCAKRLR